MSNYYNGTSAYKIDEIHYTTGVSAKESIARREAVRQSKKALFAKRMRVLGSAFCVFAVALGILFANAIVIEKSSTVNEMQNNLNALTEENNQIVLDIERNLDLNKIEDIAINELGMKRPDNYQVVYVDVEQTDYVEVLDSKGINPSKFSSKLSAIGSGISRFVEYMN